jgi:hypothetical protein
VTRPKVIKMGGAWLWRCDHGGPVGDELHEDDWRDPWSAALALARKHAVQFHSDQPGEVIGEFD